VKKLFANLKAALDRGARERRMKVPEIDRADYSDYWYGPIIGLVGTVGQSLGLTIVVLLFSILLSVPVFMPGGMPEVLARVMVWSCMNTGQCNFDTLLGGMAVAALVFVTLNGYMLFSFFQWTRYQTVDEENYDAQIVAHLADIESDLREIQVQLYLHPEPKIDGALAVSMLDSLGDGITQQIERIYLAASERERFSRELAEEAAKRSAQFWEGYVPDAEPSKASD